MATHALSIFGDHSDVMAVRSTGWAMLAASSVQEVHDFALIAQAATLESRIPFVHFFDGFRTSHEVNKIEQLSDEDILAMIPDELVRSHRERGLDPARPVLRGSAQNPDVFFQAREAVNPYYDAAPEIVQKDDGQVCRADGTDLSAVRLCRRRRCGARAGDDGLGRRRGRRGGRSAGRSRRTRRLAEGASVSPLFRRGFHPGAARNDADALRCSIAPKSRARSGEPLYQDVVSVLAESWDDVHPGQAAPRVIGGRYGLSSKEFTPAMVAGVFEELNREKPKRHFTVGIIDDVTHASLSWDADFSTEADDVTRAVFYGLGSDGTVGANKNSVKILGEDTPLFAQGYFVYDSKKSGSVTVSHLRFSPRPIHSTYLIRQAGFVACHQFHFLERMDVLATAEPGATFLLNSPFPGDAVWDHLPVEVQHADPGTEAEILRDRCRPDCPGGGLGRTHQHDHADLLFRARECAAARRSDVADQETPSRRRTASAANRSCAATLRPSTRRWPPCSKSKFPTARAARSIALPPVPAGAPDFVSRVTAMIIAGQGDLLPVSALPVDGTFPTGTARYEKRSIAKEIPIWDADLCIQCGLCALVCPHAAIRSKAFESVRPGRCAGDFHCSQAWTGKDLPDHRLTIQVAPDDCTGCGVCVDVCPARSKEVVKHKAINMSPKLEHLERERANFEFFLNLPEIDRGRVDHGQVKGSQLLQPLFEFSGACAGCGETPYLKLLTQLFGDRMIVANATGCSSIYGGNLPTTPWSTNVDGRGPAWSNSLFEDNAEFGLGMRLALDSQETSARVLLKQLAPQLGESLAEEILTNPQQTEAELAAAAGLALRAAQPFAFAQFGTGGDARFAGRRVVAPQRVDRRGRRLGLRYRLWRARSRAGQRPQRERPGTRHAGLFQHRRSGFEGDAAGRRRQVRRSRQNGPPQRSGHDGRRLRQRLRGAGRRRRQSAADGPGLPRSRVLPGIVADHRLQPLHRPRHRHVDLDDAPERGGEQRLLALVPIRPAARARRRASVPSRQPSADAQVPGFCPQGGAVRHAVRAPIRRKPNSSWPRPSRIWTNNGTSTSRWPASTDPSRYLMLMESLTMTVDLTTQYLGMTLRNPMVVSSCPLTGCLQTLRATGRSGRRGRGAALGIRRATGS